jgi:phosphoribosylglycinamide formyltransferase 1
MKHVAIFASGAGSNAEKIIQYFAGHSLVKVQLVVSNKAEAGVVGVAHRANLPVLIIEKENFFRGDHYIPALKAHRIDFIVLAGFLWKVPAALIDAYRGRILNIHPALLPGYGGKGMYGAVVHQAVIDAGEKESGITIHYVDEHYDHGDVVFQERCTISENETADTLAEKIHQLEHTHYPRIIEKIATM